MKKAFLIGLLMLSMLFTGCFDTVEEITINEDGSGTISKTTDMSSLLGLAKQFGGDDAAKASAETPIDTSFSMTSQIEKDSSLTEEEKNYLKNGTMRVNMNMKNDKAVIATSFPFSQLSEISIIKQLSAKTLDEKIFSGMNEQMAGAPGMDQMPKPSSLDNYYTLSFSNGLLEKKVNEERYATAKDDQYLKMQQESASMGITSTSTWIINLPRPAKTAEGKSIKLSDDKRKVTVVATAEDFFRDPANLAFRIEY